MSSTQNTATTNRPEGQKGVSMTSPRILSSALFGAYSRYCLVEFQTRFGWVEWQVSDAETPDPVTGLSQIIRQCRTREEAVSGLE